MKKDQELDGLPGHSQAVSGVRSRPILFSGPMVRALLAGTKTQTRRITKPQPVDAVRMIGRDNCPTGEFGLCLTHPRVINKIAPGPYGVPGDVLYVRETWRTAAVYDDLKPSDLPPGARASYDANYSTEPNDGFRGKTRVSIHMPRWASRISLRITDVRVERLNEISEADALAEGMTFPEGMQWGNDPKDAYFGLWEQINGAGSWAANPWVWAVSFAVIAGPAIAGTTDPRVSPGTTHEDSTP